MKLLKYSMLNESEKKAYQRYMGVILKIDGFTQGRIAATDRMGGRTGLGGAIVGLSSWVAGSSGKGMLEAYLRILQKRYSCSGIDKNSFPHDWDWFHPSAKER